MEDNLDKLLLASSQGSLVSDPRMSQRSLSIAESNQRSPKPRRMSLLKRINSRLSEVREKSLSEERRKPVEPNTAIGKRVASIVKQRTMMGQTLALPDVRRFSLMQVGPGADSHRSNTLDSNALA